MAPFARDLERSYTVHDPAPAAPGRAARPARAPAPAPPLGTDARLVRGGLLALAAGLVWTLLLPATLALDAHVQRVIQSSWTAELPALFELGEALVAWLLGGVLAAGLAAGGWRRFPLYLQGAAVVGAGALLGEYLKAAIERPRPRAMPFHGSQLNSFPSGHVMNTTMLAVLAMLLARRIPVPPALRRFTDGAAVASIALQALCRIGGSAHWASDAVASILFGVAWALAAPALVAWGRANRGRATAGVVAFGATFAVFRAEAVYGLRLPVASDPPFGAALAAVEAASAPAPAGWAAARARPIGRTLLARDPRVDLELALERAPRGDVLLRLGLRHPCFGGTTPMRFAPSWNGRTLGSAGLRPGWREYEFPVAREAIRRGRNELSLRFDGAPVRCAATEPPGYALLAYARLWPD